MEPNSKLIIDIFWEFLCLFVRSVRYRTAPEVSFAFFVRSCVCIILLYFLTKLGITFPSPNPYSYILLQKFYSKTKFYIRKSEAAFFSRINKQWNKWDVLLVAVKEKNTENIQSKTE